MFKKREIPTILGLGNNDISTIDADFISWHFLLKYNLKFIYNFKSAVHLGDRQNEQYNLMYSTILE